VDDSLRRDPPAPHLSTRHEARDPAPVDLPAARVERGRHGGDPADRTRYGLRLLPGNGAAPHGSDHRPAAWSGSNGAAGGVTLLAPPTVDADAGRPVYAAAKRAFDIVFALTLLLVTLPLWLVAAVLVRLSSPGPVFFQQERSGKGGTTFRCWKFRTMVDGAEDVLQRDPELLRAFEVDWKLEDDPRLTAIGRWLRRTSIDELPQLINVLRGEMSIVGPRPVQPRELRERFGEWRPVVTAVKPGLTSLWSVSGRSTLSYEERVRLEVDYVRRRGFRFDLLLVLLTVPAVLGGRGAR
jgi:lipopolysaccharide/colanic/teichoic acid biosynthesis glycosyltransferase